MNMRKKYWDDACGYILLLIYGACLSAATYYTIGKFAGWYPNTPWFGVILFDFSQIIYISFCAIFIRRKKKFSSYSEKDISTIKIFITISLFIQYNFIIHFFSNNNAWSSTFVFMGFVALLFDTKLMLIHLIGYMFFLFVGHLLYWDQLLPDISGSNVETLVYRMIILFFTSVSILSITNFAEKFLMEAQEKESENMFLMEKQLEYYQNCDLMDKELRKFHHDIKGHFVSMNYLLKKKSYDELSCYFTDLTDSFAFHENLYFSGNLIIDSILNYDLPNGCDSHVKTTVSGRLGEIETIPSIDLCTIFSNMLSNAIDAVNHCKPHESGELSICFDSGLRFFSITIINSIPINYSTRQAAKASQTPDRNHGYGIRKIKEICEKHDGTFEQYEKGQKITTTVYLPL